jgi:meso-butanediol dehydrogenase / (S,S)-butanediol dehydrogenase / diacetyl reductase
MAERFKDKVVIVTGAASDIGEATAGRFCAEGAKIVFVDLTGKRPIPSI